MDERILALDVGDARIGIAVSDPTRTLAQPVEVLQRKGWGPDTRRIQEDNLCILLREYTENPVPRRLRLIRHNGDLLPDQTVDQRGFPHIWTANDRDESRLVLVFHKNLPTAYSLGIPSCSITYFSSRCISARSASSM